jgi:thiosulfate/3-mercaptopyruvate sulfurtransferase
MEVNMKKRNLKSISLVLVILLVSILLVACNDTSYDGSLNIVEASQVEEMYLEDNVIVIDARGQEEYAKGHLKNSICLSPKDLIVDKPVSFTIAPKSKVEGVLSDLGITNDSIIYIYDDNGGVSSSRVWWTLDIYGHENVFIINGGTTAILKQKLEITTEVKKYQKTEYIASEINMDKIVDFDYIKSITEAEDTNVKIIDARSIAEYEAGNIPSAILYPHTKNLYSDGTFMSSRDTFLFYSDKDINREDEIILYCKSSFRATQALVLLEEAGYKNVKVYDGAWLEWEANGGETNTPEADAPITSQDAS